MRWFRHADTPWHLVGLAVLAGGLFFTHRPLATITLMILGLFTAVATIPQFLRGFRFHRVIRPGLYVLSFFLPLAVGASVLPLSVHWDLWSFVLVFGGLMVLLSLRVSDLRAALDPEVIPLLPPVTLADLAVRTWYALGGAAGEEFFYRGYLLPNLHNLIGWPAHLVATAVFVWMHWFGYFRSEFSRRDYLCVTVLSLLSGIVAIHSGSLLPSLVLHMLYNTPAVLHYWLRYRYSDCGEHRGGSLA